MLLTTGRSFVEKAASHQSHILRNSSISLHSESLEKKETCDLNGVLTPGEVSWANQCSHVRTSLVILIS